MPEDFDTKVLTPERVASLIIEEHIGNTPDNPLPWQIANNPTSSLKLKDLGKLTADFPATHFGNEFTKVGRELKMVDKFYDLVVKKITSDPDAASSSGEPGPNNRNTLGVYRTTLDVGPQKMSFAFEEKGPTPNLLRVYYKKYIQPQVSENYYFEISPQGIRMSNFVDTGKREAEWKRNFDVNDIGNDFNKEELTNKDRYALHMFEKAVRFYLNSDQRQPPLQPA